MGASEIENVDGNESKDFVPKIANEFEDAFCCKDDRLVRLRALCISSSLELKSKSRESGMYCPRSW